MPESRRRSRALVLAAALPLAAVACGGPGLAPADAAARVAGENLPYAEFEDYVSTRVGLDTTSSSVVLSGLLDQFLDEVLLRRLAVDDALATAETPSWSVVDALLAGHPPSPASEAEVLAYYRQHRDRFTLPERVVLRQVLAESRESAAAIAEALRRGDDFDELAVRYLEAGASASEGEITREDLPVTFVDRIFGLEPGEVSEVVSADYGFHVFQVVERLPAEEWTLEDAMPEIAEILAARDRRQAVDDLVAEARARYNPRVYARNLPFNYEGRYEQQD